MCDRCSFAGGLKKSFLPAQIVGSDAPSRQIITSVNLTNWAILFSIGVNVFCLSLSLSHTLSQMRLLMISSWVLLFCISLSASVRHKLVTSGITHRADCYRDYFYRVRSHEAPALQSEQQVSGSHLLAGCPLMLIRHREGERNRDLRPAGGFD